MEKLVYALWKPAGVDDEAFCARLLGEVAPQLLAAGVRGLALNLPDAESAPARHLAIARAAEPVAGTLSVWLDTALARAPIEARIAPAVARFAGHLVLESVPKRDPARLAPPGRRTPGFQTVAFLEVQRGLDHDTWLERWQGRHTRIAIETQSTFQYVQNRVVQRLHADAPPWAAIVEEGFPAEAAADPLVFYAAGGSQERLQHNRRRMIESCQTFIDFDRLETHPFGEYVLLG